MSFTLFLLTVSEVILALQLKLVLSNVVQEELDEHHPLRSLQVVGDTFNHTCTETPWKVTSGHEFCEEVEDGCIQTVGYPNANYANNASCVIIPRRNGYRVRVVHFETESGVDNLWVGDVPFSGNRVKRTAIDTRVLWTSDASNTARGWKLCPVSACTSYPCPLGYKHRIPSPQHRSCSSLECQEEDFHRCCSPLCRLPANLTSGYRVRAQCETTDTPGWYVQGECEFACETAGDRFVSGARDATTFCTTPGGEFHFPGCQALPALGTPPWFTWHTHICQLYGWNCMTRASYPDVYDENECFFVIFGRYLMWLDYLDSEEEFDRVRLPWGQEVSGQLEDLNVEPFIYDIETSGLVAWIPDRDNHLSGFRFCARALCSMHTCAEGYIFRCEQMDAPCIGIWCGDEDTLTCCRAATTAELDEMNTTGNEMRSPLMAGCVTTTTTQTVSEPAGDMLVGYITFSGPTDYFVVNGSLVIDAWFQVLAHVLGVTLGGPLGPVVIPEHIGSNPPDYMPRMRVGYEVPYGANAGGELRAMTNDDLLAVLGSIIGADFTDVISVVSNIVATEDIAGAWASDERPLCDSEPGWMDDRAAECIPGWQPPHMCTRYGTNGGYMDTWTSRTFEQNLKRRDPEALTALEACCGCGGGWCKPGTFVLRHEPPRFCAPCSLGRYSPTWHVVGECYECPVGTYASALVSRSCDVSSPGYYVPVAGSSEQTPCPPGEFSSQPQQAACDRCEPGTYAALPASQTCLPCDLGRHAPLNGSSDCEECSEGFFSNESGALTCSVCPPGKASGVRGSTACEECMPGRYSMTEGSSACSRCDYGQYASEYEATECEACKPGDAATEMGLSSCVECPQGTESLIWGATVCQQCSAGTHKPIGGANCSNCGMGQYSPQAGASECVDCPAGRHGDAEGLPVCHPCEVGRFMRGQGAIDCQECPPGEFQGLERSSECSECAPGRYRALPGGTDCMACDPGTVTPSLRSIACTGCEPGQHSASSGQTQCAVCPTGTITPGQGFAVCSECAAGQFSPLQGRSECTECAMGRFAGEGGLSACLHCSPGTYADQQGRTDCTPCSDVLPGPPQYWKTFSSSVNEYGDVVWDDLWMATNVSACGCISGSRPDGASEVDFVNGGSPSDPVNGRGQGCTPCGEGLICLGMGKLRIVDGYAWDGDGSVYDCKHAVLEACVGGIPGTCAPGRDETVLACAECMPGRTAATDGSCGECAGADYMAPVMILLVLVCLAVAGYVIYDRPNSQRPTLTVLLILISVGQFLTVAQQLGVVSTIRIEWVDPLDSVFAVISRISFLDVELLKPSCLVTMNPVRSYLMRVLAVYIALAFISVAHMVSQAIQHRHNWRKRFPVLFCALGTVAMAFFVSIITTMLGPLQCKEHPNDKKTLSWFPSVECTFDADDHGAMITIGSLACLLPLLFLVASCWAAKVFPAKLVRAEQTFLTCWAFLFLRFHADAHWYGPVLLTRNALVSVAPTLPTSLSQIIFLQVVLFCSAVVIARIMPWRVLHANYLELVVHVAVSLIVTVSGFYVDDRDNNTLVALGMVGLAVMPTVILIMILHGLYIFFQREKKPYQLFLCHSRVGAGCFARLLKLQLLSTKSVSRKVFIDYDDLRNLDSIFDVVTGYTETLVAIHSAQLLTNCWCVGEIVAAHHNAVPIKILRFSHVEPPKKDFIENFESHVKETSVMYDKGMTLHMVCDTLNFFASMPAIHLPEEVSDSWLSDLIHALMDKQEETADRRITIKARRTTNLSLASDVVLILADQQDSEAACAGLIMRALLQPIIAREHEAVAEILTRDDSVPEGVKKVLLMCSNGIFSKHILNALLTLGRSKVAVVLPVISSSNFSFPTMEAMAKHPDVQQMETDDADFVARTLLAIFTEIGVNFEPSSISASEAYLVARAQDVAKRLYSGMRSIDVSKTDQGSNLQVVLKMTSNDSRPRATHKTSSSGTAGSRPRGIRLGGSSHLSDGPESQARPELQFEMDC